MRIFPLLVLPSLLLANGALANDSFNSEFSHVAGSAAMAGGFTLVAAHYWPSRNSAWTGFGISAGIGLLGESVELAMGGDFSLLDAGADILGAAIGAYATDRWILVPVIEPANHYAGVVGAYRF